MRGVGLLRKREVLKGSGLVCESRSVHFLKAM